MTGSPPVGEALSLARLERLVLHLWEERAVLRAGMMGFREEIARLKGLKGWPKLKLSGRCGGRRS